MTEQGLLDIEHAEDAVPTAEQAAALKVERGQVWMVGDHRLMCGNAVFPEDVKALLGGVEPDLVITDPPYNSGGAQEAQRTSTSSVGTNRPHLTMHFDLLSSKSHASLIWRALDLSMATGCYVFTDWRLWPQTTESIELAGFGLRAMIVWNKARPAMGVGWRSQHELVAFGNRRRFDFDHHAEAIGNVITLPRSQNIYHLTQKPIPLIRRLLAPHPVETAETIYDPFAGSASVAVAAHSLARRTFSMEIDPANLAICIMRLSLASGLTPSLVA